MSTYAQKPAGVNFRKITLVLFGVSAHKAP
jgi:hypothetical protein